MVPPPPQRPSRRAVLGAVGLLALAGCLGDGDDAERGESVPDDGRPDTASGPATQEPETARSSTPEQSSTETPTPPEPPESVGDDWPLEAFDASGRASNPAAVGPESEPVVYWERTVESGARLRGPVVADDVVAVAEGLRVVGIEAPTGHPLWSTPLDAVETSMTDATVTDLAMVDDHVLASVSSEATGPSLHALDARSGDLQWSVSDRGLGTTVHEGTVFAADAGEVHATALADRTGRWTYDGGRMQDVFSGPVVGGGRVVLSADSVYALDAADGSEQWVKRAGTHPESPVVDDDHVYTGGFYGEVVAQRLQDGTERWRTNVGAPTGSVSLGVGSDGTNGPVLAETNGTQGADVVHALDRTEGTRLWSKPRGRVAAAGRGVVYHVDGQRLDALDVADGSVRWSSSVGFEPRRVVAVGRFLVASGVDGTVRMLG